MKQSAPLAFAQPLATALLFVSTNVPMLGIPYKSNDLLCLASFTYTVFKGHPCCSADQYFIPFYAK